MTISVVRGWLHHELGNNSMYVGTGYLFFRGLFLSPVIPSVTSSRVWCVSNCRELSTVENNNNYYYSIYNKDLVELFRFWFFPFVRISVYLYSYRVKWCLLLPPVGVQLLMNYLFLSDWANRRWNTTRERSDAFFLSPTVMTDITLQSIIWQVSRVKNFQDLILMINVQPTGESWFDCAVEKCGSCWFSCVIATSWFSFLQFTVR